MASADNVITVSALINSPKIICSLIQLSSTDGTRYDKPLPNVHLSSDSWPPSSRMEYITWAMHCSWKGISWWSAENWKLQSWYEGSSSLLLDITDDVFILDWTKLQFQVRINSNHISVFFCSEGAARPTIIDGTGMLSLKGNSFELQIEKPLETARSSNFMQYPLRACRFAHVRFIWYWNGAKKMREKDFLHHAGLDSWFRYIGCPVWLINQGDQNNGLC